MNTASRHRPHIRKKSRRLARSKPVRFHPPLTWTETAKLMGLLAALWVLTLGIFSVIFLLNGTLHF